jgi:uncharacterized protein (DUF1697 family)
MPATYVALLRGINVGKAKRVAMAELRALMDGLGFLQVQTLLNSGNVVFRSPGPLREGAGLKIETAMTERLGVSAKVTILSAEEVRDVVDADPLKDVANDPARLLVAVLRDPADRTKLEMLAAQDWSPGALVPGRRVGYLWCPDGILQSPLLKAVEKTLRDAVTTRNWATMKKLRTLADVG